MDEDKEQEDLVTYKGKYTCSNCGAANEDDVPWGKRLDESRFECPRCGCET